ncbi:MAG: nucleotidyl transferase AbiEii/AbiGii toxin family protein [Serpentinimonas sp.]|nr:nucleotidyl transferase AbiEii/AbiGii toxin family protein [Serpentinimonas sp.]
MASLRPEIKVDLNARPPVLPTARLPIASMLNVLIQAPASDLQVECIGVEEALAEKVLSFLRRTAQARAGQNRADYDDRLVRHLYDVRAITRGRDGLALPHEHFAVMVAGDAVQFRNQYPEFEQDPVGQMRVGLNALLHEADAFERDYLQFVDELVFGEQVTFAEARAVFIELAERLLAKLPAHPPRA